MSRPRKLEVVVPEQTWTAVEDLVIIPGGGFNDGVVDVKPGPENNYTITFGRVLDKDAFVAFVQDQELRVSV